MLAEKSNLKFLSLFCFVNGKPLGGEAKLWVGSKGIWSDGVVASGEVVRVMSYLASFSPSLSSRHYVCPLAHDKTLLLYG